MTEWNAAAYDRVDGLQQAMAGEVLGRLRLHGAERVLDVGCGEGKISAAVAERVPAGSVLGVDASRAMIDFATRRFAASHPNLSFAVADARRLGYREAFDEVISFNALHWVQEQDLALRGIRDALTPGGRAHLRLVSLGPRQSLEAVIEATAHGPRWSAAFRDAPCPYRHLEPDAYAALAARAGLAVESVARADHCWNFSSADGFRRFAQVTFVEWTRRLPAADRADFIDDVLAAYRPIAGDRPGEEHCFRFYQMDVVLRRPPR
ncbi:MAG: class I SAM-dependent methyltransferase [Candidatus Binatia bacterium]